MTEFNNGNPWSNTTTPISQISSGHYVPIIGYDANYLYVVTWGQIQKMTWAFYDKYGDEAWVMLSQEMLNSGKSPEGVDLATLQVDLNKLDDATDNGGGDSGFPDVATAEKNLLLAYKSNSVTTKKKYERLAYYALAGSYP